MKAKTRSFGQVIRERRRQLDLTQEEVAARVATSTPYIGHLESNKRHPSVRVVAKLADVLGLDRGTLFFLANPGAKSLLTGSDEKGMSAWEQFRRDDKMRRALNVSAEEMQVLAAVSYMGEARSPRDFVYILNCIRHALGR
ncbi:MAG TPA: helix-turn-helix transcriptional regulator [Candidatus Binataceae bacterium]|nr:helix-turn-helix transcriptional regulator [Candidatus Binataceae bacterium]